jgi:hypothetical protein
VEQNYAGANWARTQDRTDEAYAPMPKSPSVKKRNKPAFGKDRRRKHHHWQATIFYADGEKFARVYIDQARAHRFADRQKKSLVVKSARVRRLG